VVTAMMTTAQHRQVVCLVPTAERARHDVMNLEVACRPAAVDGALVVVAVPHVASRLRRNVLLRARWLAIRPDPLCIAFDPLDVGGRHRDLASAAFLPSLKTRGADGGHHLVPRPALVDLALAAV